MWGGGIYADNLRNAIAQFRGFSPLNPKERRRLEDDIIKCYLKFGATPSEYFMLNFENMKDSQRAEFLTDKIKDIECMRTLPLSEYDRQLTNKFNFYNHNKQFFHRKAIIIKKGDDQSAATRFIKQCVKVFIKPNNGSYGHGAFIYEYDGDEAKVLEMILEIVNHGDWIAEELIEQTDNMAKWNLSSVNTIRMPSFYAGGKYHILGPFLRTGRKGSVVDNAGSGGLIASIDPVNGKIITEGCDEFMHRYKVHPDSNIPFIGEFIPEWDALTKLTAEVHNNMPGHKYIAFDFALTPKGWVLVEGNWGQYIGQQITCQIGFKNRFLNLMSSK